MNIKALAKRLKKERVIFVGLGIENLALLEYLLKQDPAFSATIYDARDIAALAERYAMLKRYRNLTWKLGEQRPHSFEAWSLIIKSSGAFMPPAERRRLAKLGITVSSALQCFLDICPTKNIIGVTGTKGKGTTSSLIYAILKRAGKRVWLGGNIGTAVFGLLPRIKKSDWVVLELSSFQLEDMQPNPRIAVFTNLSPEHLAPADKQNPNYHVSYAAYWQAKLNLARFQDKKGVVIADSSLSARLRKEKLQSRSIFTETSSLKSRLPGEHNKRDIALAAAAAKSAGASPKAIASAVAAFKGLPYRLQLVASVNDIDYYNDSFSTTPASTITALAAFNRPVILIAGGADKRSDFSALAKSIAKKAKSVILFQGDATPRLKASLRRAGYPAKNLHMANSMKAAMAAARRLARRGDIILLSPACASFGLFKSYKDRGEQFNGCLPR